MACPAPSKVLGIIFLALMGLRVTQDPSKGQEPSVAVCTKAGPVVAGVNKYLCDFPPPRNYLTGVPMKDCVCPGPVAAKKPSITILPPHSTGAARVGNPAAFHMSRVHMPHWSVLISEVGVHINNILVFLFGIARLIFLDVTKTMTRMAIIGAFFLYFWYARRFPSICDANSHLVDMGKNLPRNAGRFWISHIAFPFSAAVAQALGDSSLLPRTLAPRALVDQLRRNLTQERNDHRDTQTDLQSAQKKTSELEEGKSKLETNVSKLEERLSKAEQDFKTQLKGYQNICLALITALYTDISSLLDHKNVGRVLFTMKEAEAALVGKIPWRPESVAKDPNDVGSQMRFRALLQEHYLPAYPYDGDADEIRSELTQGRMEAEASRKSSNELDQAESRTDDLKQQVHDLMTRVSNLQATKTLQKETISQLNEVRTVNATQAKAIESQQSEIKKLHDERRTQNSQLQQAEKHASDLEKEARLLQKKLDGHDLEIRARDFTIAQGKEIVKSKDIEIQNLKRSGNDLQASYEKKSLEVVDGRCKGDQNAEKIAKYDQLQQDLAGVRSQLQNEKRTRADGDEKLAKEKSDRKAEQELAEMTQVSDHDELINLENTVDELRSQLQEKAKALVAKDQQCEEAEKNVEKARKGQKSARSQLEETSKELQEMKQKLNESEAREKKLDVDLADVSIERGQLEFEQNSLRDDLAVLRAVHAKCPKSGEVEETAEPSHFDDDPFSPSNQPEEHPGDNDFDNFYEPTGDFANLDLDSGAQDRSEEHDSAVVDSMEIAATGDEVSATEIPSTTPQTAMFAPPSASAAAVADESNAFGEMEGVENTTTAIEAAPQTAWPSAPPTNAALPPFASNSDVDSAMEDVQSTPTAGARTEIAGQSANDELMSQANVAALLAVIHGSTTPSSPPPTLATHLESLANGSATVKDTATSGMAIQRPFPPLSNQPIQPPNFAQPTVAPPNSNIAAGPLSSGLFAPGLASASGNAGVTPSSQMGVPSATPKPSTASSTSTGAPPAPRVPRRPPYNFLTNFNNARKPSNTKKPATETGDRASTPAPSTSETGSQSANKAPPKSPPSMKSKRPGDNRPSLRDAYTSKAPLALPPTPQPTSSAMDTDAAPTGPSARAPFANPPPAPAAAPPTSSSGFRFDTSAVQEDLPPAYDPRAATLAVGGVPTSSATANRSRSSRPEPDFNFDDREPQEPIPETAPALLPGLTHAPDAANTSNPNPGLSKTAQREQDEQMDTFRDLLRQEEEERINRERNDIAAASTRTNALDRPIAPMRARRRVQGARAPEPPPAPAPPPPPPPPTGRWDDLDDENDAVQQELSGDNEDLHGISDDEASRQASRRASARASTAQSPGDVDMAGEEGTSSQLHIPTPEEVEEMAREGPQLDKELEEDYDRYQSP